jgi:hypothetical protein
MRSFKIEVAGMPYRGLWRRDGSDSLEVRSDYGTVWTKLGSREPGDVAREILAGMVPPPRSTRF